MFYHFLSALQQKRTPLRLLYLLYDKESIYCISPGLQPVTGRDELDKLVCSHDNIWVFIAQLIEHCSANAEAMGSNAVEALKSFLGLKFAVAEIASTTAMITSPFHALL